MWYKNHFDPQHDPKLITTKNFTTNACLYEGKMYKVHFVTS